MNVKRRNIQICNRNKTQSYTTRQLNHMSELPPYSTVVTTIDNSPQVLLTCFGSFSLTTDQIILKLSAKLSRDRQNTKSKLEKFEIHFEKNVDINLT